MDECRGNLNRLQVYFQTVDWHDVSGVDRSFVKNMNNKTSSGAYACYSNTVAPILLSVVIPTSDAFRDGKFPDLLSQISKQSFKDYEIIVLKGDSRQGRAINTGASIAQGKYLMTLDDDTSLPDEETFVKLIDVMDEHPDIGMAGGNNTIPANVSHLVRKVMQEIPRRSWNPVTKITDSDLAEHPCLIMRTEEFKEVGGENELIPRGLDPYLRQVFRHNGKRVVLAPNVIYHHLPPDSLRKLVKQFFRNGRQAAFVNKHYPQWVIETPANHGDFIPQRSIPYRALRYSVRLIRSLFTNKPIRFLCEISYLLGYIYAFLANRSSSPESTPAQFKKEG